MTSLESYYKFLLKINRNNTQGNITCDVATYVIIYNESQRRWLNNRIPSKTIEDLTDVQSLIVTDVLQPLNVLPEFAEYALPEKWFYSTDSYVIGSNKECKNSKINLREINTITLRDNLFDDSNKPSLEFEWSFFTIESDKIKVYRDGFTPSTLHFSYYKEPQDIDIEGYIKIDETPSTNINPELADIFVDQIISEAASEYMRNYEDANGLQFAQNRQISENKK